ncbi:MAG: hypothetical protein Q8N18_07755 [Opitutaceae bacterium]|nr:hypothetical protein [Opitutaceae bacterium]
MKTARRPHRVVATYRDEIVATVSRQLAREFGDGFGPEHVPRRVPFAALFPR